MKTIIIAAVIGLLIAMSVIWFGLYNVAANDKHLNSTEQFLKFVLKRSISTRSADIKVPDLTDTAQITEGAVHYAEMCTGCHLAPGLESSELNAGLYPTPPVFTSEEYASTPEAQFWVIKNGIKMTGMPAWSPAHTDEQIWGMVAFLQKIKSYSAEQYTKLSTSSGGGHSHGAGGHGEQSSISSETSDHHDGSSESTPVHHVEEKPVADDGHNHSH
ncbi:c-type cytochrome [sulfur-oxidizing endosymbiont of Gigantopelta aegis]|uniref:c-type cytochrome n=1 Tax=sulfur-oxidizing endosymbiont of Gigantopelta aegis TaxID=2794934 RepID=UPI0018DB12A9|nr:cytochrome c [sulfur-oxidizing endosymbiont of Gigantopelta aegis]